MVDMIFLLIKNILSIFYWKYFIYNIETDKR